MPSLDRTVAEMKAQGKTLEDLQARFPNDLMYSMAVKTFNSLPDPTVILFYRKDDPYGWMSNFYPAPEAIDDFVYPTNEHYYQSKKAKMSFMESTIRRMPTAYDAFKAGRSLLKSEFVSDWDTMKIDVMLRGLVAKFYQNKDLRAKLLETGDAVIHEDSPSDRFWGYRNGGQDQLGKLLMQVRETLKP